MTSHHHPASTASTACAAPAPQAAGHRCIRGSAVSTFALGALLGALAVLPAQAAPGANPDISLILSGNYLNSRQDTATYRPRGLLLPGDAEVGPGGRGFSLAESELGLAASIDPWTRGQVAIAFTPEDTVSVEEAYVASTALPHGLKLKAGRFFSGIGYLNEQHAHTWDFIDNPLAYQVLLGTQFGQDGLQLRWLAPTEQFVEFGVELGKARGWPGGDTGGNGASASAVFAHVGGDIGESHSWRAGVSQLLARSKDQGLDGVDAAGSALTSRFTGRSRVTVVDAVWKWAPGGNAVHQSFKLQGEWIVSRQRGELALDPAGSASTDRLAARPRGGYVQGVWGFTTGWRAGLRLDRVSTGSADFGSNTAAIGARNEALKKTTAMLDWSPSEFSRLRLQVANDRSGLYDGQRASNRTWGLQYQVALGAHGAHGY